MLSPLLAKIKDPRIRNIILRAKAGEWLDYRERKRLQWAREALMNPKFDLAWVHPKAYDVLKLDINTMPRVRDAAIAEASPAMSKLLSEYLIRGYPIHDACRMYKISKVEAFDALVEISQSVGREFARRMETHEPVDVVGATGDDVE